MHKNLKAILFFLFVMLTTFLVAYFAEAAKVVNFLNNQKELYENDYNFLIQKTIIADNRDKTNAYVLNKPLYEETFANNNNKIALTIKSFVSFKGDNYNNGLVFIISDVNINDLGVIVDDYDKPIIDVKIYYEPSFVYKNKDFAVSQETFIPVLDQNIAMFYIDYEMLTNKNGDYVDILKIDIYYRTAENEVLLLQLKNFALDNSTINDLFSNNLNKDLEVISKQNIMLKEDVKDDYTNNELIYFDELLLKNYQSFNSYYYKYLSIEAIIIIVLGYFSFFHKDVYNKYLLNKMNKRKAYEQLKEQIEKEQSND